MSITCGLFDALDVAYGAGNVPSSIRIGAGESGSVRIWLLGGGAIAPVGCATDGSAATARGGAVDSLDVETLVQAGITHKQSNQNTGRKDLIMQYASEKVCG
jgi:hypothetical protein